MKFQAGTARASAVPGVVAAVALDIEPTLVGDGSKVAHAVQNAHDHACGFACLIVDGVGPVEDHTQVPPELSPFRMSQRVCQQSLARSVQLVQEPGSGRLRSSLGNIRPDFRQILFGAVGYLERAANSCFPRAMMRSASKVLTRPAATSTKP